MTNEDSNERTNNEISLEDRKYQNPELKNVNAPNQPSAKDEKKMEEMREKLESLKKFVIGKFKSIEAMGIIPPQASEMFDEENELSDEEKKNKPMHLVIILPDDKEKEFNQIKSEVVKKIAETKQKIWLNLFLERDLWELCMDSKYNIIEAIGMSFPLYDKGLLGSIRVAQVHKSLVLRKFEKYVYSYVIWGSLVRGEAVKTSDVDVAVIIDDTDVKRMPRLELKEKLRNIIYSYIMQANELAGVKNPLNVQVYLLTEFWDGVKDANPVFYTFLRDGVPLYDRGGFLPWKLLLRMGKIKPSPESIDMFMSMGDKTQEIVKRKLLDIVMSDLYWSVITPSQGLLMLYGLPPTTVRETVNEIKKVFVDKEKMLEKKYWEILEEILIKYYKGYEHEKIKEVSGTEIDRLLKNTADYLKRLKELRTELEKRMMKKSFEEIYANVFKILKSLFGDKSETELIKEFEKELINKGKANPKFLHTLNELTNVKKKYKTKKIPGILEFESLRKDSVYLVEALIEYGQRKELGLLQKTKVILTYNDKHAELFLTNPAFLVIDGKKVKKITNKVEDSDVNELNQTLTNFRGQRIVIDANIMKLLRRELGDFDICL
ncbi:MAG: nucleotidyltransferase domain-containing protein [Candidatus Pacearchaeota archaeon]|jgi:predicted nucleotidyltransferase